MNTPDCGRRSGDGDDAIRQRAQVVEVRGQEVILRADDLTNCELCAAGKGCGAASIARLFGARPPRVSLADWPTELTPAVPGQRIELRLDGAALLRAAMAVYLPPLAALFGGALIGQGLGDSDLHALIGAALAFVAVFYASRRWGHRWQTPRMSLHPLPPASAGALKAGRAAG